MITIGARDGTADDFCFFSNRLKRLLSQPYNVKKNEMQC